MAPGLASVNGKVLTQTRSRGPNATHGSAWYLYCASPPVHALPPGSFLRFHELPPSRLTAAAVADANGSSTSCIQATTMFPGFCGSTARLGSPSAAVACDPAPLHPAANGDAPETRTSFPTRNDVAAAVPA